jgi:6-pyruvoyltetrahydropterin/6-carboxytetrahydropterin synthase
VAIISKEYTFEASHQLQGHKGKCARLHGHSYVVTVFFSGDIRQIEGKSDDGFVIDFGDISAVMKPLITKYLDHHNLNETLNIPRTTAELIACWIFGALSKAFPEASDDMGNSYLHGVMVQETATSSVEVNFEDWDNNGRLGLDADVVAQPAG